MTNKILRHNYQVISELGNSSLRTTYLAMVLDPPNNLNILLNN